MGKPTLSAFRLRRVRINRLAPTNSRRLKPICKPTANRRKRRGPPPAITCCLSAGTRLGRQNCTAGAKLKSKLASTATAKLKKRILASTWDENGMSVLCPPQIILISTAENRGAKMTPISPPASPNSKPSITSCRITRVRLAPSA